MVLGKLSCCGGAAIGSIHYVDANCRCSAIRLIRRAMLWPSKLAAPDVSMVMGDPEGWPLGIVSVDFGRLYRLGYGESLNEHARPVARRDMDRAYVLAL